mgnify:FL=1
MELTVLERRHNPLLRREEVRALISFEGGTPTRKEVREALAKALGKDVSVVFVRRILTEYGARRAKVLAMVYEDRDYALKIEPEHVVRKNEGQAS